jgi:N-acetyl-beta-hexosaminidase
LELQAEPNSVLGHMLSLSPKQNSLLFLVSITHCQVPTACWDNPTDNDFITNQKLNGVTGLFSYWVKRVHEIATSLGRRVIMWDAAFNAGSEPPPKDVVIQMWLQYGNQNTLLQEIVNAGCVVPTLCFVFFV